MVFELKSKSFDFILNLSVVVIIVKITVPNTLIYYKNYRKYNSLCVVLQNGQKMLGGLAHSLRNWAGTVRTYGIVRAGAGALMPPFRWR